MEAPEWPKRFYEKAVAVQTNTNDWQILLDGRAAKTSAGNHFSTPSPRLAKLMAVEWQEQEEFIMPPTMPLSQRRMLVIDRADKDSEKWRDQILAFLASDLLCYRAEGPEALVLQQERFWGPYLEWAGQKHGIELVHTAGIIAVDQPEKSLTNASQLINQMTVDDLCCVVAATEITGSAVLALALWQNDQPAEDIFMASRVDETFQAEKWGFDAEAAERQATLKSDFLAIAAYLEACH